MDSFGQEQCYALDQKITHKEKEVENVAGEKKAELEKEIAQLKKNQ